MFIICMGLTQAYLLDPPMQLGLHHIYKSKEVVVITITYKQQIQGQCMNSIMQISLRYLKVNTITKNMNLKERRHSINKFLILKIFKLAYNIAIIKSKN